MGFANQHSLRQGWKQEIHLNDMIQYEVHRARKLKTKRLYIIHLCKSSSILWQSGTWLNALWMCWMCQPRQGFFMGGEASTGIRKGSAVEGGFAVGIRSLRSGSVLALLFCWTGWGKTTHKKNMQQESALLLVSCLLLSCFFSDGPLMVQSGVF